MALGWLPLSQRIGKNSKAIYLILAGRSLQTLESFEAGRKTEESHRVQRPGLVILVLSVIVTCYLFDFRQVSFFPQKGMTTPVI